MVAHFDPSGGCPGPGAQGLSILCLSQKARRAKEATQPSNSCRNILEEYVLVAAAWSSG